MLKPTQGMWREVRVLRRLGQMSWNWKFLVGSGTCYAARAVWSILLKWSRPRHLPPPWARVPTPQSSGFPVNFGKKNKVGVPRPIPFVFVFVFESFFLWVKYPKNCKISRCLLDNVVLLDSLDMGDDDESPKYQLEDILNRNWKNKIWNNKKNNDKTMNKKCEKHHKEYSKNVNK